MSIRSILLHLADDPDHMTRLRVAFNLSRRHKAHLTVMFITTPVSTPFMVEGRGASMSFIEEATEMAQSKSDKLEAELSAWCKSEEVTYGWERYEGDHLKLLAKESYYHDMAIVSQSDPHNLEEMLFAELPDHLALVSPTPVLVLPHQTKSEEVGQHVLIAWKECREAARALHYALPFLEVAKTVTAITVSDDQDARDSLDAVGAYLNCHGIKADLRITEEGKLNAHDHILDTANATNADMIVMGGFSQKRMMQLVLGGATRRILSRTHAPIFMAH